jgi:hypothetical protein
VQRAEGTARQRFGEREGVAPRHDDVLEGEGRESCHLLGPHLDALPAQLRQCQIGVPGGPEHERVGHQPERPELVLLPRAIALAQFPLLPVEDGARQAVAALPTIELRQDASAIRFVVDEREEVQRFGEAPELADGPRQPRSPQCAAINAALTRWRATPSSAP